MSDDFPASSKSKQTQGKSILVRGVNWLGDAVMALPALERLREAHPAAKITLLTPAKLQELFKDYPYLDAVLPFDPRTSVLTLARQLRALRYESALLLPNSPRSAIEAWLAGIPERVGFARPWRTPFLTRPVPPRPQAVALQKRPLKEIRALVNGGLAPSPTPVSGLAHQVYDYLALAAAMGARAEPLAPRLYVHEEDIRTAKSQLMPAAPSSLFWCALNPGAEYGPAKRWPADRFAAAAAQISRTTGCGWIITGGKADAESAMRINHALSRAKVPHTFNLAGRTSLRQLSAIYKLSRLVLTNDTGPMHVAAAVGTPVVVPFGSTSPDLTGPGFPEHSPPRHALVRSPAPCSPCYLRECPIDFRCMLGISVEEIVESALALLATTNKGVTIHPS